MNEGLIEFLSVFLSILLLLIITWLILSYYSESSVETSYFWALYIALFLGFVGVIIFPIDIGLSNEGEAASKGMTALWNILYFMTGIFAWGFLPVMMGYWKSGEFSRKERVYESLKDNIRQYLVLGIIGALVAMYIILSKSVTISSLVSIVMALVNTYGLVFIVIYLGVGLVSLPLFLFRQINPAHEMDDLYRKGQDLDEDRFAFEMHVVSVKCNIREVMSQAKYKRVSEVAQTVLNSMPEDTDINLQRHMRGYIDKNNWLTLDADSSEYKYLRILSKLNSRSKNACLIYERKLNQFDELLHTLVTYRRHTGTSDIPLETSHSQTDRVLNIMRRVWFVIRKPTIQFLSFFSLVCTGMTIFTEITTILYQITEQRVSPFSWAYALTSSPVIRIIFGAISLIYVSSCFFYGFFTFNVPFIRSYELYPHHTDVYALSQNTVYLCRFQFSLFYHYFTLFQLPSSAYNEVALTAVLGQMTTIPFLGTSFNSFMPLFVVVVSCITVWNMVQLYQTERLDTREAVREREVKAKQGKEMMELYLRKRGLSEIGSEEKRKGAARYYYKSVAFV